MDIKTLFHNNWKFVALLVIAVVLLVVFLLPRACKAGEKEPFQVDMVLFGDVPMIWWNSPEVRPIWSAGVRIEGTNILWNGLGIYTQYSGGKADIDAMSPYSCNQAGCQFPQDYFHQFTKGEYFQTISAGVIQRINLFGK